MNTVHFLEFLNHECKITCKFGRCKARSCCVVPATINQGWTDANWAAWWQAKAEVKEEVKEEVETDLQEKIKKEVEEELRNKMKKEWDQGSHGQRDWGFKGGGRSGSRWNPSHHGNTGWSSWRWQSHGRDEFLDYNPFPNFWAGLLFVLGTAFVSRQQ